MNENGYPLTPLQRRQIEVRLALLEMVTPQDIADITDTLVRLALRGDVGAAKLLFAYVFGRPQ